MAKYDYKGAIHVHSTYSDGTGDMAEIAQAANDAGLDFVLMTDAGQAKAVEEGCERWNGSALIICGTEIAPGGNPYIAFGEKPFKDVAKLNDLAPQAAIEAIQAQNGFGFLAHPDHLGSTKLGIPSKKWNAWDVQGYTGLGLWDLMTDWLAQVDREDDVLELHAEFEDWLTGPRIETLKRWDELNQKAKVVGIGEVSNRKYKKDFEGKALDIFPYETAFKTVVNHILLDEPLSKEYKKARKQVLNAVKHGNLYVSFDWWDDPTEFSYEIDNGKKVAGMGDEIELTEKVELVASFPSEGLLNVYRNGESVLEEEGDELLFDITEPGAYRVEAMRNDIVWILSNNIVVKAPQA